MRRRLIGLVSLVATVVSLAGLVRRWLKLRYLAGMNVSAHRFFFYFYGFFRPLAERVVRRA